MKPVWSSFAAGGLFGAGLVVSGMAKPAKVIGFLDVGGRWDASLAFVMIGAIAVHAVLYRIIMKRRSPLFDVRFHIPTRRDIDARLIVGAALFGAGWGLGGYCPGPGLVSLGAGMRPALVLIVAMAFGMWIAEHLQRFLAARQSPSPAPKKAPTKEATSP